MEGGGGGGLAIKEGSRNKVWVVRRMLISGVVFFLRVKKRSFFVISGPEKEVRLFV